MSVEKIRLLNIDIDNWTFDDFLQSLQDGIVFTPNVDHLIKLQKDEAFYRCYEQADHVVCDSRILLMLSKIFFKENPIKAQIAGSDLFPAFCRLHANNDGVYKIFLLGGSAESVKVAQKNINAACGGEIVVDGYSPPFGFEKDEHQNNKILELVKTSGANVLAVGVGAPKQEKWICANREKMPNIRIFFAIGATIEFEAGALNRAPKWMTRAGIEWLYRLGQEPGRLFKRYILEDLPIFWMLLKQKFGRYKNPFA